MGRGPLDPGVDLRPSGPPSARKRGGRAALKSTLVAFVSSAVFFGLLAAVVVNSPGWTEVKAQFFDPHWFWYSLPFITDAFLVNVQLFCLAEVLILVLALLIAVLRSLPGPVFFPVRLLATIYADVFRAIPGLLLISLLGFGIPGLGIAGIPVDPFPYAVVALTLVYSAYVSEVYRAGIESIHPSQEAAARSLGLSRFQALRYVIIPQAVRRVIPPLLNDFIGLQKDTILVSYIGVVEAFRESSIIAAAKFNYTPYMALALIFLVVTIPLARLTDLLVTRDRRRFLANAR
jgi:polar amino acid transport system permease protein